MTVQPAAATGLALAPTVGVESELPPINTALEPASVRNGSPATQRAYATALQFEDMLVQQLSQSLVQSSGLGGEGEGGGEEGSEGGASGGLGGSGAVTGQISSLLPQTLANGVMSQGGFGLASELMGQIKPAAGGPAPKSQGATGGVAA